MSERKSQLEKFNARMSKMKRDEDVVKQTEMKNNTVEKKAEKIAKQHDVSTEDIFAVITRESITGFVQLWNNSMESTIRETIRGEVREIIREVVQEQMVEAYKGIVKGMMDVESIVKEEMTNVASEAKKPQPEYNYSDYNLSLEVMPAFFNNQEGCNLGEFKVETPEQHIEESAREKRVGTFKKGKGGRPKGSGLKYTRAFEEELKEAVIEAHYEGVDVTIGKTFKKHTSRNNTLYQKFLKQHQGQRGAWQEYCENLIPSLKDRS